MNYYNEHDPNAATWLEELVAGGDLPPGLVDSRDVQDIGLTEPLDCYNQCHFFAGIGGWPHALDLAGCPRDRAIWTASLPCQPFSDAGKSLGVDDERHLWPTFHRLVEQYRPECVVGEQVASKAGRAWFATVQADLEALGYRCGAVDLCAAGVGSPHIRQRLYWCAVRLGDSQGERPTSDKRGDPAEGRSTRKDRSASGNGGVADNEEGRRGQVGALARGSDEGSGAQRSERPEHGGSAGGLGHAERIPAGRNTGTGAEAEGEAQLRAERDDAGSSGSAGGVADGNGAGLEVLREQPARQELASAERGSPDSWGDVVYVPCADGKPRPLPRIAQSCSEPLVDGFPARLVRGCDPGAPPVAFPPLVTQQTDDLNDTSEARTMRLKGYGNAIVAPLAAEFISAFMEILDETPTRRK